MPALDLNDLVSNEIYKWYRDEAGRPPDLSGLALWVNYAQSHGLTQAHFAFTQALRNGENPKAPRPPWSP